MCRSLPEDGALDIKFFNIPLYTATHEGFFKRYGVGDENAKPINLDELMNNTKEEKNDKKDRT